MKAKHIMLAACLCAAAVTANAKTVAADKGIKSIETVAESFGDGEKVSRVVITYAKKLDAASVGAESYAVECTENGKNEGYGILFSYLCKGDVHDVHV